MKAKGELQNPTNCRCEFASVEFPHRARVLSFHPIFLYFLKVRFRVHAVTRMPAKRWYEGLLTLQFKPRSAVKRTRTLVANARLSVIGVAGSLNQTELTEWIVGVIL